MSRARGWSVAAASVASQGSDPSSSTTSAPVCSDLRIRAGRWRQGWSQAFLSQRARAPDRRRDELVLRERHRKHCADHSREPHEAGVAPIRSVNEARRDVLARKVAAVLDVLLRRGGRRRAFRGRRDSRFGDNDGGAALDARDCRAQAYAAGALVGCAAPGRESGRSSDEDDRDRANAARHGLSLPRTGGANRVQIVRSQVVLGERAARESETCSKASEGAARGRLPLTRSCPRMRSR